MRVAINGFGRIGKEFFLACMKKGFKGDFVINNIADIESMVYTLKYDSVHEAPKANVTYGKDYIKFGNKKIKVYHTKDPSLLPWKAEKIDLVVECTGLFTHREDAEKHIQAGAKMVLISAPAKGQDCTYVYGINKLDKKAKIISAGSCTTNCVTPMVKILNDAYKIEAASFVTTHAYTSTQRLIDAYSDKDPRRGRAAAENIEPSTSGASISVVEAVPELKGKLDGYALRVPVADGSISTLVVKLKKNPSKDEINALFKKMASSKYKGIVEYSGDAIVSSDIIDNPNSCIFDSTLTYATAGLVSVAGWYDNEWGYANRLADITFEISKR